MNIKLLLVIVVAALGVGSLADPARAQRSDFWNKTYNRSVGEARCKLASPSGQVKHVVFITFDNVHFFRDRANVPSDLELMPSLLNYLQSSGTMMTYHNTPLISHTATDILTSLTGLYPDRMGIGVANSYRYFKPDGTSSVGVAFGYWSGPIFDPTAKTAADTTPLMVNENGVTAPAPWVPFTRAGCDVGNVGTANAVLENTATDITTIFGANSPEAQEAAANGALASADFVGISVHCAQGSLVCQSANAKADVLPNEPGGYNGFLAVHGHKYVAPLLTQNLPLTDLSGNVIADTKGNVGFPTFDGMVPAVTLSYAAQMLENGVPVVFAYISDAHDIHPGPGSAAGPGEASYVAQLKTYDAAFAAFFARLAAGGIDQTNTVFVVTSDENDRFVGSAGSPPNCDGIVLACTYAQLGEVNVDVARLLATQTGDTTKFGVHSDMAPAFWVNGNPTQLDPGLRQFTKNLAAITTLNPISGNTDVLNPTFIDRPAMKFLHILTNDPLRNPNIIAFSNPDYFVFSSGGTTNCSTGTPCITEPRGFAWNHGGIIQQVTRTWLGIAGPGIKPLGRNDTIWSDHADIRPTLMRLTGLTDDYSSDGRVITEALNDNALPASVSANRSLFESHGAFFKQINAPVGQLGINTVIPGVTAGMLADDTTYTNITTSLTNLTTSRDALVLQMKSVINGALFSGQTVDPNLLNSQIQAAMQVLATPIR